MDGGLWVGRERAGCYDTIHRCELHIYGVCGEMDDRHGVTTVGTTILPIVTIFWQM